MFTHYINCWKNALNIKDKATPSEFIAFMVVGYILIPVLFTLGLIFTTNLMSISMIELKHIILICLLIIFSQLLPRITVECRRLNAIRQPLQWLALYYTLIFLAAILLYCKVHPIAGLAVADAAFIIEILWLGGFFTKDTLEKTPDPES
jgi:uncharacterized membrane protein YhaH (DUF805 family)